MNNFNIVKPDGKPSNWGFPLEYMYSPSKTLDILEIGSDNGESCEHWINLAQRSNNDIINIYCVDPYKSYQDWNGNDLNSDNRKTAHELFTDMMKRNGFELVYITSVKNIVKYCWNRLDNKYITVFSFHCESDYFFQNFSYNFDIIYIDGLHTYDQVLKDCENSYKVLNQNGVLCGHDFFTILGVGNAVVQFKALNNIKNDILHWSYDCWGFKF